MPSETEKSTSAPSDNLDEARVDERDQEESDGIALPSHVAGSGTLDRLVDTAREYARAFAHARRSGTECRRSMEFEWCWSQCCIPRLSARPGQFRSSIIGGRVRARPGFGSAERNRRDSAGEPVRER